MRRVFGSKSDISDEFYILKFMTVVAYLSVSGHEKHRNEPSYVVGPSLALKMTLD